MVGRFRSKQGIRFLALAIPIPPNKINFDRFLKGGNLNRGEEIYVLAHRPGIGKTYSVMKYLTKKIQEDKDFRFFYFTDRHNAIIEHTKDWKKGTYSHWEGFNRICKRSWMKSLYKYHISPKDICTNCTKKCNQYTSQFKNTSRVFAPFNYLLSKDFQNNLPDIIFLDENIKQFNYYSAEIDEAKRFFKMMGKDNLLELIEEGSYKALWKSIDIDKFSEEYKEFILNLTKSRGKNKKKLEFIEKFNIFNFYQFLRWESIYGYRLKTYSVPLLYYGAFDAVAKGVPAAFLDATFSGSFLCYLLECYNAESKFIGKKSFTNLRVRGYRLWINDIKKESTIYRMRPEYVMPKSSFTDSKKWDHTKDWLSTHMKFIMDVFGRNNVGIITSRELGDFTKAIGYDVEYYGNLRGLNVLENKPVLVIIGSYIPILTTWHPKFKRDSPEKEGFDELLSKYFLLDVNEKNLVSVGIQAPEYVSSKYNYKIAKAYAYKYIGEKGKLLGTRGDKIVNNPAEALNLLYWYDEIYQAFHRNRGLRYPRIIFAYCWFPEPKAIIYATDKKGIITSNKIGNLSLFNHNLRDEFKIDKIFNDKFNELFDYLSGTDYGKGGLLEEIVADILQHPNITSKELTAKYKSHKTGDKRGADTIPMTMLIKGIRTLMEKAKRIE